ncbi:hypothetical protein KC953_01620 [Candidatus Saccharibacteria bacterium]|nr:hypothetical protein [Candidatus Saccharibacteria bacterium]
MSRHQLKSIAQRGTSLTAAMALVVSSVGSAVLPAMSAYADALNPLTNRSLTLSSSSPGWDFTDGSGNATYAPPNSGANGQKTGNYFDFKVSSTATVKTLSFQYCTTSAGNCLAPGDNGWTTGTRNADTSSTSDLNIHNSSAAEIGSGDFSTIVNTSTGAIQAIPGGDITVPTNGTDPGNSVAGNFAVYRDVAGTWTQSTGWTLSVHNAETGTEGAESATGKNNYMVLTNASGVALTAGQQVKVVFFASDNDFYITNPGSSWFFVKINTYDVEYNASPSGGQVDLTGLQPDTDANVIDGGVTVANVMNHSIRIQTKVLETMQFSVGTVDPNTLASDDGAGGPSSYETAMYANTGGLTGTTPHAVCDPIVGGLDASDTSTLNVLSMGNTNGENSLEVGHTYSTHSYWRLSSNSSAGATVYYSGNTLANTVGDEIAEIGAAKAAPQPGSEQFGLALTVADNTGGADEVLGVQQFTTDYAVEATYEQGADGNLSSVDSSTTTDVGGNASWHSPRLYPLVPTTNYNEGAGDVNGTPTTKFAFVSDSTLIPVPIANETTEVVDCVTGRMRYVANIAATTPAGIYTTAINYIAAPQY